MRHSGYYFNAEAFISGAIPTAGAQSQLVAPPESLGLLSGQKPALLPVNFLPLRNTRQLPLGRDKITVNRLLSLELDLSNIAGHFRAMVKSQKCFPPREQLVLQSPPQSNRTR